MMTPHDLSHLTHISFGTWTVAQLCRLTHSVFRLRARLAADLNQAGYRRTLLLPRLQLFCLRLPSSIHPSTSFISSTSSTSSTPTPPHARLCLSVPKCFPTPDRSRHAMAIGMIIMGCAYLSCSTPNSFETQDPRPPWLNCVVRRPWPACQNFDCPLVHLQLNWQGSRVPRRDSATSEVLPCLHVPSALPWDQ